MPNPSDAALARMRAANFAATLQRQDQCCRCAYSHGRTNPSSRLWCTKLTAEVPRGGICDEWTAIATTHRHHPR